MRRAVAVASIALSLDAAAARAQSPIFHLDSAGARPTRLTLGFEGVIAKPRGEFATNVDIGWGGAVNALYALDAGGIFSLRGDLGALIYGHESKKVPLSPTIGGRITVDLTTTNGILLLGAGPQLMLPGRWVRPFANAALGVNIFSTTSAVSGTNDSSEPFASTNNSQDAALAYSFGGGLYVPFSKGDTHGGIVLGARYYNGGEASYLRSGDITDNPDGTVTLNTHRSRTDMLVYQVGVSFRMRR